VAVGSSAILVLIYIKMHHILEGSDHHKIYPVQREAFSNYKRFRYGLKFIDQNLNKAHVWTTGATKAATPNNKVQT
jgi:hypothetical protein